MGEIWAWHPPVGVWIGVLGLLGVLVPLIRDLSKVGKREKALWTLLLFVLLLLEIKSVYQDRSEHDRQQAEARDREENNFKEIAGGIKDAIAESDRNFNATMNGVSENLQTLTGSKSYAYLRFVPGQSFLAFTHSGKYPLYGVSARIADLD